MRPANDRPLMRGSRGATTVGAGFARRAAEPESPIGGPKGTASLGGPQGEVSSGGPQGEVSSGGPKGASSLVGPEGEALLRGLVRDVPDFPRPGIVFKDITPLLASPVALRVAVSALAQQAAAASRVDIVLAAEARGFLLGPALALRLDAGFALARKPGKLPHRTVEARYQLEYRSDALQLHADALPEGARVLIHDDLLATGGTAKALCELVQRLRGVVVGCSFLIELSFLSGRERLLPHQTHSLLRYDA